MDKLEQYKKAVRKLSKELFSLKPHEAKEHIGVIYHKKKSNPREFESIASHYTRQALHLILCQRAKKKFNIHCFEEIDEWVDDLFKKHFRLQPCCERPKKLYRYYDLSGFGNTDTERFDNISQLGSKIKATNPRNYNDYFEIIPEYLSPNTRTISFSNIAPTDEKPEAQLMAAHYTKKYAGICIEYEYTDNTHHSFLKKIEYTSKKEALLDKTEIDYILQIKHPIWDYENEYRLFIFNNTPNQALHELSNLNLKATKRFEFPNLDEKYAPALKKTNMPSVPLTRWFKNRFVENILIDTASLFNANGPSE